MAAADPLDGRRRPSPGRVAGAAARWRNRPFQGRRDPAQGPAENPAAPYQHYNLVIMFADQLANLLRAASRPARVLIFRRLGMVPDMLQNPASQVAPAETPSRAILAQNGPDRARRRRRRAPSTSKIALFTWSTSSAAAGDRRIKSESEDFSRSGSVSSPATPPKQTKPAAGAGCRTAPCGSSSSRSGSRPVRNPQNGRRRFRETGPGGRGAGGDWTTPRGLSYPWCGGDRPIRAE